MKPTISELYKKTAEQLGVSKELVEIVERDFWSGVWRDITNATGVNIMIHGFMKFTLNPERLKKYRQRFIESYEKGNISKNKFDRRIEMLDRVIDNYNKKYNND